MKLGSSESASSGALADGGVSLGAGASYSVRACRGVRDDEVERRACRRARSSPPLPRVASRRSTHRGRTTCRTRRAYVGSCCASAHACSSRCCPPGAAASPRLGFVGGSPALLQGAEQRDGLRGAARGGIQVRLRANAGQRRSARVAQATALTPARRIDGFRYGGWMTFVTSAWFCVCSGLELLVSGETQRRGSWRVRHLRVLDRRCPDAPAACRTTARWRR
jgi:hypothetical protein